LIQASIFIFGAVTVFVRVRRSILTVILYSLWHNKLTPIRLEPGLSYEKFRCTLFRANYKLKVCPMTLEHTPETF